MKQTEAKKRPAKPASRRKGKKGEKKRPPHPGEEERIALRRQRVLDLRAQGHSFPEIAKKVGCGTTTAYEDVMAELVERAKERGEKVEVIRQMELERCDRVMLALWPKVKKADARAATAYLNAMKRRAAMLGIDMPTKIAPTDPTGTKTFTLTLDAPGKRHAD